MSGQFNIVSFVERGDGSGQLVRLAPKVDTETDGTLQWDCDFAFPLGNDEAEVLSKNAVPSARDNRARATDGLGSTTVKFRPTQDGVVLSITDQNGAPVLTQVSGEIRSLELRTTAKVQSFIARVRLRSIPSELAGVLCSQLGKRIGIAAEPHQQDLFASKTAPAPVIGSIVCAKVQGVDVYGKFTGEKDGALLVSDFGVIHCADKIVTSMRVAQADPNENPQLRRYVEQAKAPSWRAIVLALGTHIGKGYANGNEKDGWQIDGVIVDDALAGAVEVLPPEREAQPVTKRRPRTPKAAVAQA